MKKSNNLGKVYRAETKYIDKDSKKHRRFVVVRNKPNGEVEVAKLKSIKKLDDNNKNADASLLEIDNEKYGLPKRTGIDYQRFGKNRLTRKNLNVNPGNGVFNTPEEFKLSSHDTHKAVKHTRKR